MTAFEERETVALTSTSPSPREGENWTEREDWATKKAEDYPLGVVLGKAFDANLDSLEPLQFKAHAVSLNTQG